MGFKLAIIGAGSSYTPEIVEGLVGQNGRLPIEELAFMDIDRDRLETVAGFCRRYLAALGRHVPTATTTDLDRAVEGAAYVITQVRVGGNAQRAIDERICLDHGFIGQETTGPAGMFKALRTIPPMLRLARTVSVLNPAAWIINYTNPTGMIAEAVLKHAAVPPGAAVPLGTASRFVGLCSGGLFPRRWVCKALGVPPESVSYAYFGLNHLNFAHHVTVDGRPLTDDEFDRVAEVATWGAVDPLLIRTLRLLPSPYLQYFFHRGRSLARAREAEHTRGEAVRLLEEEVFKAYADPAQVEKPAALAKRGGGGYSEVALGIIDALHNNAGRVVVANAANAGSVRFLPDDAVLEMPCLVNAAGVTPLVQPEVPDAVWGLVAAVKNYEQLAIEAAVTGSRDLALEALLAHPLGGDYDAIGPLLDALFEANRAHLPQFFE